LAAAGLGLVLLAGVALGSVWFLQKKGTAPPTGADTGVGGKTGTGSAVEPAELARKARAVLEANCYRCHGKNGAAEGGFGYALDYDRLVKGDKPKVVAKEPDSSKVYVRLTSDRRPMPPPDETPRPGPADVAVIKQWIEAGAPTWSDAAPPPTLLGHRYVLAAIAERQKKVGKDAARFERYFMLTQLVNEGRQAELPQAAAGVSKLVNSLSWKKDVVVTEAIDDRKAVYAVDVRKLGWDDGDQWGRTILANYPYGLRFDEDKDPKLAALAKSVYADAGTKSPYVRGDWFLATASRPPLYHDLLRLPKNARELEDQLKVNVQTDFLNNRLKRAGLLNSGVAVQKQNRLIERHDLGVHPGAYWKSYDFRPGADKSDLFRLPLGPAFAGNPFPQLAFVHSGGEIIFNLPNGLQAYLLVDGADQRLNRAPDDIVVDNSRSSGSPTIVNGLSCMSCHVRGMVRSDDLHDEVAARSGLTDPAKTKVAKLYAGTSELHDLLRGDEKRFTDALDRAAKGFGANLDVEPVASVARPFILDDLGLKAAAAELFLDDPQKLAALVKNPAAARELGLVQLAAGGVKRDVWEQRTDGLSVFQRTAKKLGLGEPDVEQPADLPGLPR
jgi:serine/threonine-protein kinase